MRRLPYIILAGGILCLAGCKTVQMDRTTPTEKEPPREGERSAGDERRLNEREEEDYLVSEKLKEVDIEKSVVYVRQPVYYPVEKPEARPKGKEAAKAAMDGALQEPAKYSGGTMFYDFDENFVYEIYCQPYRITDLALEPGEMVLENPFISESQVWEMGAGVSRRNGLDVQHFYLKPDISGLTTSMIIITDRRVYHLLLKSFRDCYMAMVEFEYPNTMPYNIKADAMNERLNAAADGLTGVDPRYLSFDYKMSYSIFKRPVWLPSRVYDDGRRTYIQMDETVLHTQSPVLFNHRNERVNYRVDKNLIVIDELIEKITMRRGHEKVTIRKKSYKEPKHPSEQDGEEEDAPSEEAEAKPSRRGYSLHAQFPVKETEKKEGE